MTVWGQAVERAREGDQAAFRELVVEFHGLVFRLAYAAARDHGHAEDIVQEVFIKVHQGLGSLREPAAFPGWIAALARRTAADWLRRRKARPREVGLPPGLEPAAAGAGADREDFEAVWSAVAGMDEPMKSCVLLRYGEGRSYREIGELLGLTVSYVGERLFRARELLAARLNPDSRVTEDPAREQDP